MRQQDDPIQVSYLDVRLVFRENEHDLAEFIKNEATANRRSAAQQIFFMLEGWMEDWMSQTESAKQ